MACGGGTKALAYVSMAYLLSCVLYLLLTRRMGTPFSDTLTEEQKKVKNCSAKGRRSVFVASAAVACLLLLVWRPL